MTRRFIHQEQPYHLDPPPPPPPEEAVWGYGVWVAIVGANVLGIWCECQMTPEQSLLQGLASAEIPKRKKESETVKEEEPLSMSHRQSSKLRVHIQWT